MTSKVMQQPWLWKRFETNAIDSYVGTLDEPIIDLRGDKPVLKICDGSTAGGIPMEGGAATGVSRPHIVRPLNGSSDISPTPLITASTYMATSEDYGQDPALSSHWEISTDSQFASVQHSLTINASGTDINRLDIGAQGITLTVGQAYYVRVKYTAQSGTVSAWSPVISFTPESQVPGLIQESFSLPTTTNEIATRSCDLSDDGDVAIYGSRYADYNGITNSGAVEVIRKTSTGWGEPVVIPSPNPQASYYFGYDVAISGDGQRFIASEKGSKKSYIYRWNEIQWELEFSLEPEARGDRPNNSYSFTSSLGHALDMSYDGTDILISDYSYISDNGAVLVYKIENNNLVFKHHWLAPIGNSNFGYSVAISGDGNSAIIGAKGHSSIGYSYRCQKVSDAWSNPVELPRDDYQSDEQMGSSVAISHDGHYMVVGSLAYDIGGDSATGCLRIYTADSNDYVTFTRYHAKRTDNQYYGSRCAISGDGSLVMGFSSTTSTSYKEPILFQRIGANWYPLEVDNNTASGLVGNDGALSYSGKYYLSSIPGNTQHLY